MKSFLQIMQTKAKLVHSLKLQVNLVKTIHDLLGQAYSFHLVSKQECWRCCDLDSKFLSQELQFYGLHPYGKDLMSNFRSVPHFLQKLRVSPLSHFQSQRDFSLMNLLSRVLN